MFFDGFSFTTTTIVKVDSSLKKKSHNIIMIKTSLPVFKTGYMFI